ncbi:MAG: sporulation protein [Acidobacteria bacterium]|nr:sporulation protein [Acidobacteriota bacterium]
MAKCDLTLHLDEGKNTFRPGETVRGIIDVRIDKDVRCDGLEVGLRWRTHGRGNSVTERIVFETLFEGEWTAGTVFRRPFAFEFPAGPYTYHGTLLNVVWEVYATADIPWAIDPRVEEEVVLRPNPEAEPNWLTAAGSETYLPAKLKEQTSGGAAAAPTISGGWVGNLVAIGCLFVFLGPLVFILGAAVRQGIGFTRGEVALIEALMWGVGGLVVIALFLGILLKVVRNMVARKKLGQVKLTVEPALIRAGEEVRVSIGCRPENPVELNGATAKVVATEIVVSGSGTNKTTHRHVVFEQQLNVAGARTLSPNMPFNEGASIRIPADASPSFYASSNSLTWTVTTQLDIARWPDWIEEREILVHA